MFFFDETFQVFGRSLRAYHVLPHVRPVVNLEQIQITINSKESNSRSTQLTNNYSISNLIGEVSFCNSKFLFTILRMSYQAGIRIPEFRVTGIVGAVGQITCNEKKNNIYCKPLCFFVPQMKFRHSFSLLSTAAGSPMF